MSSSTADSIEVSSRKSAISTRETFRHRRLLRAWRDGAAGRRRRLAHRRGEPGQDRVGVGHGEARRVPRSAIVKRDTVRPVPDRQAAGRGPAARLDRARAPRGRATRAPRPRPPGMNQSRSSGQHQRRAATPRRIPAPAALAIRHSRRPTGGTSTPTGRTRAGAISPSSGARSAGRTAIPSGTAPARTRRDAARQEAQIAARRMEEQRTEHGSLAGHRRMRCQMIHSSTRKITRNDHGRPGQQSISSALAGWQHGAIGPSPARVPHSPVGQTPWFARLRQVSLQFCRAVGLVGGTGVPRRPHCPGSNEGREVDGCRESSRCCRRQGRPGVRGRPVASARS